METELKEEQVAETVSQVTYRPTPYAETVWERLGESCAQSFFISEFSVLPREVKVDPMFAVFEEGLPPQVEVLRHGELKEPEKETPVSEELSQEKIAQIEAEWMVKVEQARQESLALAESQYQAELADFKAQMQEQLKQVQANLEQAMREEILAMEKRAVSLSLDVSRKLLKTTAEAKPEYIIDCIRDGLTKLSAAKPKRIRVSSQDFEFIQLIGLPPELSASELGVEYVLDENLTGGCVIETNYGEINLELDQMWSRVKDKIFSEADK